MVIRYTNIYNNVVFPGKKACIFRFKGRKSCANGDSVTLEFMFRSDRFAANVTPGKYSAQYPQEQPLAICTSGHKCLRVNVYY